MTVPPRHSVSDWIRRGFTFVEALKIDVQHSDEVSGTGYATLVCKKDERMSAMRRDFCASFAAPGLSRALCVFSLFCVAL